MTAAVYESDIDRFIQDQKSKLAHERRVLTDDGSKRETSPDNKRRQWDRSGLGEHKLAEQTHHRPGERTGLPVGNNDTDTKKRQLQAERNREYNEMIQKKPAPHHRLPVTPEPHMTRQTAQDTNRPDPAPAPANRHNRLPENYESPRQKQREQQLSNLEGIHHREEKLRRSLDEDKLRESDQENTLRDELWRRHQGDAPKNTEDDRRAYFRAGDYERFRSRLNEERKQEYNDMIAKRLQDKPQPRYYKRRPETNEPKIPPGDRTSHTDTFGPYRHYNEQRKQYIPLPGKPAVGSNRRLWREPSSTESMGLPIGEYERKKEQLAVQRRRDMQQTLNKNLPSERRQWQDSSNTGLKFTARDQPKFNEEKRREYNDLLSKKLTGNDQRSNLPPKPGTPGGFMNRLGRDVGKRREQLNDERRREYNQIMADKTGRGVGRRGDPGEYGASIPGMRGADSAKLDKMKKRNEEYNEFLREKEGQKRPHGGDGAQKHDGTYGTLPGLNYDNPKSSENERNREYNEFLKQKAAQEYHIRSQSQGQDVPPDAPRRGWATPTYEEMLQKKRQEEAKFRRFDDPEYRRPGGMKSYGSEGALNGIDGQKRGKDLDTELDKRLRLDDGRRSILDDPLWLSPRRGENYDKAYATAPQYPDPPLRNSDPPPRRNRDPDYYASLPVGEQRDQRGNRSNNDGSEQRVSAQQRRKEQYRRELQQQMQETCEAKRREKLEEMNVSATGAKNPEQRDERIRGLGGLSAPPPHVPPPIQVIQAPAPVYKIADPAPVYTTRVANYDQLSPRSEYVLGRKSMYTGDNQWDQIQQLDRINFDLDRQRYTAPSDSNAGILERPFDTLLNPPRVTNVQVPPGLEYKPSSFITGGGGGGNFGSIDDAYYMLGQKNPLDPDVAGAAQARMTAVAVPQAGAAGPITGGSTSRVRFEEEKRRQPPGGGSTFAADAGEDKVRSKAKAQSYQVELARQIEEDKAKKAKAKADQEWYDMKLEQEAKDYNPYGKGGGGAPMKDDRGNTMADLRAMKKGYTTGAGYSAFSTSPRPPSPRDDKIRTPPSQTTALGEVSHARGGHGIFGMPKTESEKHQSDVYKDDLRRQIEAKKAAASLERERERYEEEKEARRIEAERKKMQDEYEEERKKIKLKEDEARRKNEELMRQAEERKREAEQRRREADEERRRQQEEADRERLEREKAERVSSPPVPAVTRKQATEPDTSDNTHALRVTSPPVPAARKQSASRSRPQSAARQSIDEPTESYLPSALTHRVDSPLHVRVQSPAEPGPSSHRAPSADVLNALARMKRELASERDRVEHMLDKNENEPEVFDPRLAQRPPPVPRTHQDIDVFERARNRNTVPVRRAPTVNEHPPNPAHLHEFNELKQADTDSRQEFKRHYPYDPMSNDNLEHQQAALIRQQEEGLRAMRDKSKYERALPNMEPRDLGLNRHRTISPQPMLQSNSAFIDMNGLGPVFPDDLDDLPRRNDSARQRRRDRLFSSPRPGSVTSLDVDQIARKNEQRLKKLRDMQGDDLSMNDPDDVLDRFVSKQSHNRPPTSQTMQDDSWLQAGSKASRY